jgi:hypothetical protein
MEKREGSDEIGLDWMGWEYDQKEIRSFITHNNSNHHFCCNVFSWEMGD